MSSEIPMGLVYSAGCSPSSHCSLWGFKEAGNMNKLFKSLILRFNFCLLVIGDEKIGGLLEDNAVKFMP